MLALAVVLALVIFAITVFVAAQAVVDSLAEEFGGKARVVKGEDLLKSGDSYPMVSILSGPTVTPSYLLLP